MKIFISGGRGMVGRNLIESLSLIKQIKILAPTRLELDLMNYSNVNTYFKKHSIDLIIHCAGKVGGIQANMNAPFDFLFFNAEMGKNIVIAAKENNISNLLNIGSSCFYPRNYEQKLKESDLLTAPLEPTNEGYSIAKIYVLKLCEYISEQYNLNYKTIIPCNLYGKWDNFSPETGHMIPAVIRRMYLAQLQGLNSLSMWGDGSARREFMYVGDLVKFITEIIFRLEEIPNFMNVGLGYDYSIAQYYSVIKNVIKFEGDIIPDITKPVGMKRKILDVTLQEKFGFVPKTNLQLGIRNTVDFFVENLKYEDKLSSSNSKLG